MVSTAIRNKQPTKNYLGSKGTEFYSFARCNSRKILHHILETTKKNFDLKEIQQTIRLHALEIPALLDPFFGERKMSISRRNFLFHSATAALLAGIPLAALKPVLAFQKQRQPAPPIQSGVSIPIEAQAAPIFYMTKS